MNIVAWCFLAFGFRQVGSAWSIECTASPSSLSSEQTTYSISDGSRVQDVTESGCEYSWAENNRVLANHIASDPKLVVGRSINNLTTPKCFDNITFARNCISEGIGHRVHCKLNCTSIALVRSQKQREIPVTTGPTTAGPTTAGPTTAGHTTADPIGPIVGADFVVLLVGLLCVCLGYKFKDKVSRIFNRNLPKCIYTTVRRPKGEPSAAEEEAGNV